MERILSIVIVDARLSMKLEEDYIITIFKLEKSEFFFKTLYMAPKLKRFGNFFKRKVFLRRFELERD